MSEMQSVHPPVLALLGLRSLTTRHGEFTAYVARNATTGEFALALTHGKVRSPEPLLARVHSSCVTSETFGGCDCDCMEQLDAALAQIGSAGRGVVLYLLQEGRGAGLLAKARDRMIVQASDHRLTTFDAYATMGFEHDLRRYDEVGSLCRLLGVRAPLTVLTNNDDKLEALRAQSGIEVGGSAPLSRPASPYNQHYLRAKSRFGHRLQDPAGQSRAALPEPVVAFEPCPLPEDPRFVLVASYLLPVRLFDRDATDAVWFRVFVYFDLATGSERVVLVHGSDESAAPLLRIQRESLFDRFRIAGGGKQKKFWHAAVREMARHGAGIAAFVPPAGFDSTLDEVDGDAAPAARLLAHHLRGRAVRRILFDGETDDIDLRALDVPLVQPRQPTVAATSQDRAPGDFEPSRSSGPP